MPTHQIQVLDHDLLQQVEQAWLSTSEASGAWLVCRPGCSQCCVGAFAINSLDAYRLRVGFEELVLTDPGRAERVMSRTGAYIERVRDNFPGDPVSGVLGESEGSHILFETFANDEVCPALDPEQHTCDLYQARPMTCRVFGPPVRSEDGLGVCDLCFKGASVEEVAVCEMVPDPDDLEMTILKHLDESGEPPARTIVAYALQAARLASRSSNLQLSPIESNETSLPECR